MRRRARTSPDAESVRLDGREFPVLDRLRVGGRTYLLLERLSAPPRERYRAFDPYAGPGGDQRMLLLLPRSPATRQHLAVLKRLSGETLPKVLEYRVQGDRVVLVMTWVGGIDLAEYLTGVRGGRFRRPSAFESVRLVRGLAHGLGRLHTQRLIVHGDVRPANLILATAPQRLVLIDFGSAWTSERAAERGPGDGSSAGYAAPELQTAGAAADFRSDQFSASVILYELLTLALPYDGLGGQAGRPEFRERMRGTLAPPSRDCPDRRRMPASVLQALDRLLLTGLALDPDERFPTRRAWLDAFEEVNRTLRDPVALTPVEALLASFFETLDRVLTRRR